MKKMKVPRGIPKNSGRGLWPRNPTRNLYFFLFFSSFLWFLLRILRISEIPRKWWSKRRPKWWKNDDQNDEKMKIPRGIPKNSGRGLWPRNPTRIFMFSSFFPSFLWFLLRILRISEIPRKWWSKRRPKWWKKWWPKFWKNEDSSRHSQKLQPGALAKEHHQKSAFFLNFFIVFVIFASNPTNLWDS